MTTRADLEALPTERLRQQAFDLAKHRHDFHFFWDLAKHVPAAGDAASADGFTAPGASISDLIELFRELRGDNLGEAEPMLRAHFLDYLEQHST
ncbi:MAG TPA: hypothetical protein VNA14_08575 [Mycobacteriales bacterium]|nr:hypothetical protein [Mycobacteriales bacterium]